MLMDDIFAIKGRDTVVAAGSQQGLGDGLERRSRDRWDRRRGRPWSLVSSDVRDSLDHAQAGVQRSAPSARAGPTAYRAGPSVGQVRLGSSPTPSDAGAIANLTRRASTKSCAQLNTPSWCTSGPSGAGRARRSTRSFPRSLSEYAGKVRVARVDVDDNPDLARRFEVMSIPALIVFKDRRRSKDIDRRREQASAARSARRVHR